MEIQLKKKIFSDRFNNFYQVQKVGLNLVLTPSLDSDQQEAPGPAVSTRMFWEYLDLPVTEI